MKTEITFFEHNLNAEGWPPNSNKTEIINEHLIPTKARKLKYFLGVSNYHISHIENYSGIAATLNRLLRKTRNLYGQRSFTAHLKR